MSQTHTHRIHGTGIFYLRTYIWLIFYAFHDVNIPIYHKWMLRDRNPSQTSVTDVERSARVFPLCWGIEANANLQRRSFTDGKSFGGHLGVISFRWRDPAKPSDRINGCWVRMVKWKAMNQKRMTLEALKAMCLASLCDIFGMVKWPFSMVKWPPTRGLKGHVESPGDVFSQDVSTMSQTWVDFIMNTVQSFDCYDICDSSVWHLPVSGFQQNRIEGFPRSGFLQHIKMSKGFLNGLGCA